MWGHCDGVRMRSGDTVVVTGEDMGGMRVWDEETVVCVIVMHEGAVECERGRWVAVYYHGSIMVDVRTICRTNIRTYVRLYTSTLECGRSDEVCLSQCWQLCKGDQVSADALGAMCRNQEQENYNNTF